MTAMGNPFRALTDGLQARTASEPARELLRGLGMQLDNKELWDAVSRNAVRFKPEDVLGGVVFEQLPRTTSPANEASAESAVVQRFLESAAVQLRDTRIEVRLRVDQAFTAAMWLGVVGGVAFFVGIGLAFSHVVPVGVTSTLGGSISAFCSKSFARMYATENQHLKKIMNDLQGFDQARIGLWLADHIADPERRDAAIRRLVEQIQPTTSNDKAESK